MVGSRAKNERKTEDLIERRFRKHGYYQEGSGIVVEKQSSDSPRIRKLLEKASKNGVGVGRPEFMVRSDAYPNFLVVVECKADTRRHASEARDKPAEFAVDGVLLYANCLSKDFDVLAIAVSGQDEASLRISHFLHLRGSNKSVDWDVARDVVPLADYHDAFIKSDIKFRQDYEALLDYSRDLNHALQARKVTESERAFLISGTLIALQNKAFAKSFREQLTSKQLAASLMQTIHDEFETANIPENRREELSNAFSFIPHSSALKDRDFFITLIEGVDTNINAFSRTHQYYDTIGQFYVEFLRYANNDKGLGIVLTPHHMADLFTELAGINANSIVFDNCCGTGSLLVAAMKRMVREAGADKKLIRRIKERQIVGIEFQSKVFALAVSNMILHGDGKTNIHRGDCFSDASSVAATMKPTIGLLNPPYKNKQMKEDREELEFVLNNLDALQPDGRCVAIVPITCATAPNGVIADWKRRLLEKHTLEGVMSMPTELFHNSKTIVVTCVMVFTAHRPHPKGKKTWFGYWRDDNFVKTKHRGRIDAHNTWTKVRAAWVNAFRNREIIPGLSVAREVGHGDEWCAEAYLDTDYSVIDEKAFLFVMKRHLLSRVLDEHGPHAPTQGVSDEVG